MDSQEDRELAARADAGPGAQNAENAFHEHAALGRPLRSGFDQGRGRYGNLPLRFSHYTRGVLNRLGQRLSAAGVPIDVDRLSGLMSQTALGDLFLALACEHGVQDAWNRLVETHRQPLIGVVARRGTRPSNIDELVDGLVGDLSLPPAGGGTGPRTRLGRYQGTGSLLAWMAAILLRRLRRTPGGLRPAPVPFTCATEPEGGADALRQVVSKETVRQVEGAFSAAWGSLSTREALTVLCKYRDGVEQKVIARILGVGEPRVSRIVSGALRKLRRAVERCVRDAPLHGGLDESSFWTALRQGVENSLATRDGGRPSIDQEMR